MKGIPTEVIAKVGPYHIPMKIQGTVGERRWVWRVVERNNKKQNKQTKKTRGTILGMTETTTLLF